MGIADKIYIENYYVNNPLKFYINPRGLRIFFIACTEIAKFVLAKAGMLKWAFNERVVERPFVFQNLPQKPGARILDIGCGIGQFEERISQLDITGMDNSEAMLEEARRRSDKGFVLGNAERLGFPDGSFDAIFYITTLEFVDDYKRAINEAVRVLEPKGKLVVMMLNPESEYFKAHMQKEDSYFRKIKELDISNDHISFLELKDNKKKYSKAILYLKKKDNNN